MLAARHYFSNALGSIDYVPDAYVSLHWSGQPLNSLELRALYVHARNLLERANLSCLLADHRAMSAAPAPADQEWLLTNWLPATVATTHNMRYAVLPAQEPSHRLHTAPTVDKLRHYVSVALFDDLNRATTWLQTA